MRQPLEGPPSRGYKPDLVMLGSQCKSRVGASGWSAAVPGIAQRTPVLCRLGDSALGAQWLDLWATEL